MNKYIPLILAVVTSNALSQLFLKHGMNVIGHFEFSSAELARILPKVMFNPYIILGTIALIISMGLHLMALSRVDISFAYPFLSLAYVIVLFAAYFMLGEDVNAYRIAGVGFICIGTALIAQG
jgi:drug/metabolite transporter (DMT)-like permease